MGAPAMHQCSLRYGPCQTKPCNNLTWPFYEPSLNPANRYDIICTYHGYGRRKVGAALVGRAGWPAGRPEIMCYRRKRKWHFSEM